MRQLLRGIISAATAGSGGGGGAPSLDFSDPANSQYMPMMMGRKDARDEANLKLTRKKRTRKKC